MFCEYLLSIEKGIWTSLEGGSTLNSVKKYFQNSSIINYDVGNSYYWATLALHYKVRNIIIHKGGLIDESQNSKMVIENLPSIIKDNGLLINLDFLNDVNENAYLLFNDIEDTINNK